MEVEPYKKGKLAFSILELSVVIIIIGFLLTVSVSSTKLLANLALKRIFLNLQQYEVAMQNFYTTYHQIAGDMHDASSVISEEIKHDGDGDSKISLKLSDEHIYAFEHLYFAKFIDFKAIYDPEIPASIKLNCKADPSFYAKERLYPTYNIPELAGSKAALALFAVKKINNELYAYFILGRGKSCLFEKEYFNKGLFSGKDIYHIFMKYDGKFPLLSASKYNEEINLEEFHKIRPISTSYKQECIYEKPSEFLSEKNCNLIYRFHLGNYN